MTPLSLTYCFMISELRTLLKNVSFAYKIKKNPKKYFTLKNNLQIIMTLLFHS